MAKIENDWKVLTSLVSSSHIKSVTLWVKGMSFRSETHQRLVCSCASTWLREHHVCEKCWKSETNSLTELIVTDPDVFFPRILWKCFNNLKQKKAGRVFWPRFSICAIVTLLFSVQKHIRFGKESFSDIQLLRMCAWQEERFILPGRFSRPPFSSLPRWNIRSWKSICQRHKRTISASRNHFITFLRFRFNFKRNWSS